MVPTSTPGWWSFRQTGFHGKQGNVPGASLIYNLCHSFHLLVQSLSLPLRWLGYLKGLLGWSTKSVGSLFSQAGGRAHGSPVSLAWPMFHKLLASWCGEECMKYLRTAEWDSSTLSQDWETMVHSQLCHWPAVILTWLHLQGRSSLSKLCWKLPDWSLAWKPYLRVCPMTVIAMRCCLVMKLPGELWKSYWGTVGWSSFVRAVRWAGSSLNGSGCAMLSACSVIHAWLRGDLSLQLKPTEITSSLGSKTSLFQPVRVQWVYNAACDLTTHPFFQVQQHHDISMTNRGNLHLEGVETFQCVLNQKKNSLRPMRGMAKELNLIYCYPLSVWYAAVKITTWYGGAGACVRVGRKSSPAALLLLWSHWLIAVCFSCLVVLLLWWLAPWCCLSANKWRAC